MRWWPDWRSALMLVKPATVIAWHRKAFALYWARKSRKTTGRPRVNSEIRKPITRMATDNIGWGAPRIHGELLKLGFCVSEASVRATCRVDARSRRRRPGALSCETTCIAPWGSTSSLCPLQRSSCSTCSSFSITRVAQADRRLGCRAVLVNRGCALVNRSICCTHATRQLPLANALLGGGSVRGVFQCGGVLG